MNIGTWNEIVVAFEFCYLQSKILISKFHIHEVPFPSPTDSIPCAFPALILVHGSAALLPVLWSPSALLFNWADEMLRSAMKEGARTDTHACMSAHRHARKHAHACACPLFSPSPMCCFLSHVCSFSPALYSSSCPPALQCLCFWQEEQEN